MTTQPTNGIENLKSLNIPKIRLSRSKQGFDIENELRKILEQELNSSLKRMLSEGKIFGKDIEEFLPKIPGITSESEQNSKGMNGLDKRQMQVDVDQMVADALMNGKLTTGILRSLFGLVPSLIGR